jgi:hypothetical protein
VEKAQNIDIYQEFRDCAGEKPPRITTDINLSLTLWAVGSTAGGLGGSNSGFAPALPTARLARSVAACFLPTLNDIG